MASSRLCLSAPLKSYRRKSGERSESSTRGTGGNPPRLIADDPIHVMYDCILHSAGEFNHSPGPLHAIDAMRPDVRQGEI
jgi:hypothetical protein